VGMKEEEEKEKRKRKKDEGKRKKRKRQEMSSHLDEVVQPVDVLELCVAVEQKSRVLSVGQPLFVELLQVGGQVSDSLGVQELQEWIPISISRGHL